jgi:hypothetical protein
MVCGRLSEVFSLIVRPTNDVHQVGHKTWDVALEQSIVAKNDVRLLGHVGLEILRYDYETKKQDVNNGLIYVHFATDSETAKARPFQSWTKIVVA